MYMHIPEYRLGDVGGEGLEQMDGRRAKIKKSATPAPAVSPFPETSAFFPERVQDGITGTSES